MNASKPTKKTHPRGTNLANKLNAIMVYMAALADMIEAEQPIPGDGTGGGTAATQRALDSATEEQNRLIADMLEEIARRVFALYKARPGPDDLDQIDRVFEILRLEGWNTDALDWVYDLACDGIAIEGYAHDEIFGDAKPVPPPARVPDPIAAAVAAVTTCASCNGTGDAGPSGGTCQTCGGTGVDESAPAQPKAKTGPVRATARIFERAAGLPHRHGGVVLSGPYEGNRFVFENIGARPVGDEVVIEFNPDDQFATIIDTASELAARATDDMPF